MFEHEGGRCTVTAVVAAARNGVIGRDGQMPWTLRGDLRHYRTQTMGRPMIMGRRTLQSIGRILDGRDTIVLTRSNEAPLEGALAAGSAESALLIAAGCAQARGHGAIAIVGGAQIYELFMPWTDRIALSEVEAEPVGDTWFPSLDPAEWQRSAPLPIERLPGDTADARFVMLTRRRPVARSAED